MSTDSEIDQFISEEFDDSNWGNNSWSKVGVEDIQRLASADRTIRNVTANSYVIDIYRDATNLRNVLGDMDGIAAEIATNIRRNVLVIAATIKKKPSRIILDSVRSLPLELAVPLLERTVEELSEVITAGKRALAELKSPEGDHEFIREGQGSNKND